MGVTAFRAWPEADRLLALALTAYEDLTCSGCGQPITESMDPDLADFWTTMPPAQCHACVALAVANDGVKEWKHPHTARHVVGLREGWETHRSAARSERATADHPREAAERD